MSLTDMVIMPGADYQDACEAIREKTGGTGYIRSGEMGEQIRSISTGVELPELTNPASASDIVANKEAIDGEGNVIKGNILDGRVGATHTFVSSKAEPEMANAGGLDIMPSVNFCTVSSLNDTVLRSKSPVKMTVSGQTFGDAKPEDVAAGKTFTSLFGLKVTGTAEASGGGAPNYGVLQTSSAGSSITIPNIDATHNRYILVYLGDITLAVADISATSDIQPVCFATNTEIEIAAGQKLKGVILGSVGTDSVNYAAIKQVDMVEELFGGPLFMPTFNADGSIVITLNANYPSGVPRVFHPGRYFWVTWAG